MKKKIIGLLVVVFFLSGCSLNSRNDNTSQTSTPIASPDSSAFSTKTLPGSLWKTEDGGNTFIVKSKVDEKSNITKADILSIAYHPKQPKTLYVSSVESGIFKTEDGGDIWTPISFPPKKIYSFILDKNNPDNRMFASGMVDNWGKIFRTDDGGVTWKDVYTEPGQNIPITALSQYPFNHNVIFAGTASGTVLKSADGGETWKNIGTPINGLVAEIIFDVAKKDVVYLLTFNDKIYYSENGGMKWIDWEDRKNKEASTIKKKVTTMNANTSMPSGIVSILSDPHLSGVLYAGTNHGLYRSADFGKYWTELNIIESAKKFSIRSIAVNPQNSKEIVFVAGKTFYKSTNEGATWMTTSLNVDRGVSFITYDPFDAKYLFMGLRNFK